MMEAQNLSRLQQGQTPLLGGENPQLHDSDFSGVTPKNFAAATPHPLAAGATPLPGATPALTGATPSRAIAGTALLALLPAEHSIHLVETAECAHPALKASPSCVGS